MRIRAGGHAPATIPVLGREVRAASPWALRVRSTASVAQVGRRTVNVDDGSLPFAGEATRLARARVVALLAGVGDRSTTEVAELLTGELVANAVLHGAAPIGFCAVVEHRRLRVEVSDGSDVLPAIADDAPPVGGRGLVIVAALARAWGAAPSAAGKTVWFELDL